jgi:hypothetical protein
VRHGVEVRELKALATGYDKAVWRVDKELDRRARLATTGRRGAVTQLREGDAVLAHDRRT